MIDDPDEPGYRYPEPGERLWHEPLRCWIEVTGGDPHGLPDEVDGVTASSSDERPDVAVGSKVGVKLKSLHPAPVSELIDFLLARLDEDETVARQAHRSPELDGAPPIVVDMLRTQLVGVDPARVLADVEAKRRIVALHPHAPVSPGCITCMHDFPCPTVRLLAVPYASHPGYRPEW